MTRVTKGLCLYKNSDPKGLSAPDLGLYTCIKTWKIMYKIRFQRYFFWNLQQMGNFQMSTNSCLPLHRSYIHVEKHLKMCIKSAFKEICLKLATNGRSDKGFLLTSKVCPRGFSAFAIYMYKIIKNVYKIRFWRDHFETWNIWAKKKGISVVIKILSPMDYLPLPGAIYIWWNMKKMYIKSDFKTIFFKPATNGQSDKGFLLTSKVCPQGVVCPCPGAHTCIKSLKMCIKSDFFFWTCNELAKW